MFCKEARVEMKPGCRDFKRVSNPIVLNDVKSFVNALKTPDLHSVCITGGEPLQQSDFLRALCMELGGRVFLETNGTLPKAALSLASHIDFACVDIKDQTAMPYANWEDVVKREFETIKLFRETGVMVFAKVVVTNKTSAGNIRWFAKELSKLGVPLAIQPVTSKSGSVKIKTENIFRLSEAAAQYLSAEDITISFQTHKKYGLL
jgi:organic radical activating enzyme